MEAIPYLAALSALAGLGLAGYYYTLVKTASPGNDRMVFLMTEIQKGAKAFLKTEYKWVASSPSRWPCCWPSSSHRSPR